MVFLDQNEQSENCEIAFPGYPKPANDPKKLKTD